jgi:hypothetical protein
MYGITTDRGTMVLCQALGSTQFLTFVLKRWDRATRPVMMSEPLKIDELLQRMVVHTGDYSLKVFEFTREQEEEMLIRRLKGPY